MCRQETPKATESGRLSLLARVMNGQRLGWLTERLIGEPCRRDDALDVQRCGRCSSGDGWYGWMLSKWELVEGRREAGLYPAPVREARRSAEAHNIILAQVRVPFAPPYHCILPHPHLLCTPSSSHEARNMDVNGSRDAPSAVRGSGSGSGSGGGRSVSISVPPAVPRPRKRTASSNGGASLTSSIANLANTIIGTGMVALPGNFVHTGWLLGLFLIALCGFTGASGLYLLTRCANKLGGRRQSFFSVAMKTIPKGARWFDLAIALKVRRRERSWVQLVDHVLIKLPRLSSPS